ncbi:MAG: glycosyltransferase family 2 protein [Gemmatimonadales bacterium]|nr:glycosyltransferase family 2 protein [Gemmatimonadales bacterium]
MSGAAERVTAIITYYRNAEFFGEALASVLAQTRPADEILVVDDASPAADALDAATLPAEVRLIRMPVNSGPGAARQRASSEARGELLAYLDADDLWAPTKLERQVAAMRAAPECPASHTGTVMFHDDGRERSFLVKPARLSGAESALGGHALPSCLMVRASALAAVGGWSLDRSIIEDWDLELRLTSEVGPYCFVAEPLMRFRRFAHGNLSSQHARNIRRLISTIHHHRRRIDGFHGHGAWRGVMRREIREHGEAMGGVTGRLVALGAMLGGLGSPRLPQRA